jgi:hypothetical protein
MYIKIRPIAAAAVIFALSTISYATGPGFYFGLGAGPTEVYAKKFTFTTPVPPGFVTINPSTSGIGERLFMGYDINQYAAIEGGFEHFGTATYKIPASYMVSCNNPSIRQSGFDLEGKGKVPFYTSGVNVFAKFGMAVMYAGSSGSLESNSTGTACGSSGTSSKAAVRPMYGLGLAVDLNPSWVADVSWTHVNGGGNIASADFAALSISYHIVDTYCGQFLC